ncbi:MAG: mycothiol system anti-sigma-R factor [Gemmatimonadales bacterium]|nr:MAG: mycothiol system anti-sigma-R factor [Gemmatimonadales bacterium]
MNWVRELRRLLKEARGKRTDDPDGLEGGLTCQEAADHLQEWLDSELDEEMAARVGVHLETCARCYPRLAFERAFREAVERAARAEKAPPDLKARVLQALESEGYREE